MNPTEISLYKSLIGDIKSRVRQAQNKAALSANAEMIFMYWDIGRMIEARQIDEGWGAGVIPRLASDLKNELPEEKGFSARNLGYMVRFYREYGEPPILQQGAAKLEGPNQPLLSNQLAFGLPWFHHVLLMQKFKDLPTRFWYARQALEQGWSRDSLTVQIRQNAHLRQGSATSNFNQTLPEGHSELARQLLKDPYIFDFLTLEEPFHERELETGLLEHAQKFLLELGRGFAFVGRQYRLEASDQEFYLDLLFYHLQLRCFVVVELKKGNFKPEYAGKMNFYCSMVDDLLRHADDKPTLGLILCQTKDRVLAEYALRDIHKPIGVAEYELTQALPTELATRLPSIETLEAELTESLKENGD